MILPLFDIHPHFADSRDTARLTGQNSAILARLREGPATNVELAGMALKYTSRISDIRSWLNNRGKTVLCKRGIGGLSVYRIAELKEGD